MEGSTGEGECVGERFATRGNKRVVVAEHGHQWRFGHHVLKWRKDVSIKHRRQGQHVRVVSGGGYKRWVDCSQPTPNRKLVLVTRPVIGNHSKRDCRLGIGRRRHE